MNEATRRAARAGRDLLEWGHCATYDGTHVRRSLPGLRITTRLLDNRELMEAMWEALSYWAEHAHCPDARKGLAEIIDIRENPFSPLERRVIWSYVTEDDHN